MKVRVSPTGLYTYPDVSVACNQPEFEDEVNDVLLNPQVIVEILSDTTEADDRGKKFEQYRQIASFQDYLLVAQKRVYAELYTRQLTGGWLLTEFREVNQNISLERIQCKLNVGDLYRKVTFVPSDLADDKVR
jgi:Uma2 family endonuclease